MHNSSNIVNALKDTLLEYVNAKRHTYLIFPLPVTVVLLNEVLYHRKVAPACCMSKSTALILIEVQDTAYILYCI